MMVIAKNEGSIINIHFGSDCRREVIADKNQHHEQVNLRFARAHILFAVTNNIIQINFNYLKIPFRKSKKSSNFSGHKFLRGLQPLMRHPAR